MLTAFAFVPSHGETRALVLVHVRTYTVASNNLNNKLTYSNKNHALPNITVLGVVFQLNNNNNVT